MSATQARWDALAAQLTKAGYECRAARLPIGTVRYDDRGPGYEISIQGHGDLVVIRDQYDRRTHRRTYYQMWRENRDGIATDERFGLVNAASIISHIEATIGATR